MGHVKTGMSQIILYFYAVRPELFLPYFLGYDRVIFLPKQSERSRSILDGSRSLGLFWKGKTCDIANFHRTGLIICSQSRLGKNLPY